MTEKPTNHAFERWCFATVDPRYPSPFGKGYLPLLTVFLHRVCGNDGARFNEGIDILRAAFEAGQASQPAQPVPEGQPAPMRLTLDEIMAGRTKKGGWTRAQLAEWGVPWPPKAGWKRRLMLGEPQ